MARSKKYELICNTYQLLKHNSPDKITIRMIADASHCSSTAIYRHFENLDHLILIAAIRFLDNYIESLDTLFDKDIDPLELHLAMWRSFSEQAFQNAEIFEMLFWGKYNNRLTDAIIEYYQLYPNKWNNLNGIVATVFFDNNLEQRNLIMVKLAAAAGYFSYDRIELFSEMQCQLFHGLLIKYINSYHKSDKIEDEVAHYMDMLTFLVDKTRFK